MKFPFRKSYIVNRQSDEGIALIMTLILLSVTLVMAIAFLAVSRRERGSVSTESDSMTAKFAADAALAHAEAQINASLEITTNPYYESLLVSTNYYNNLGFNPSAANPTNVNYNYQVNNGGPLTSGDEQAQNIANLYFSPRPPVYYSNDFRFYLDLNRNGRFDTNGVVTNFDNDLNDLGSTSLQVGDPEWIGILEHPDQPHGPNNPFIARYCFIAVPADSLDINNIHNEALMAPDSGDSVLVPPGGDAYSRDQGISPWEINLAAFLADLNTNRWDPGNGNFFGLPLEPYDFPEVTLNSSFAFDDARSLVAWRYGAPNAKYDWLASVDTLYGTPGDTAFRDSGIDGYSDRRQVTFDTNYAGFGFVNPTLPWPGAPNTNDFFYSPSELFNPTKSSQQFVNDLQTAGTYNSTYDRYTYYRMLNQLGTDSSMESGKLNLNYSNAIVQCDAHGVLTNFGIIPDWETNFYQWQPQAFFTAAANMMLHDYSAAWYEYSPSNYMQTYYGLSRFYYTNIDGYQVTNAAYAGQVNQVPQFGITNIPVYINGQFVYTPAVNRVLQLAANIYDASTNTMDSGVGISNYPSVFRPVFWTTNEFNSTLGRVVTNVYIKGYQPVPDPLPVVSASTNAGFFSAPVEVNALPFGISTNNVWGVPWIVGAKKGFPNFNAFEWQSSFFIERELQYTRNTIDASGRTYTTNQEYIMGISNLFGSDDWNSYAETYHNPVTVVAQDYLTMALTNGAGYAIVNPNSFSVFTNMPGWSGGQYVLPFGASTFAAEPLNPQYLSSNNTYVYLPSGSTVTASGVSFTGPTFIPTSMNPPNIPALSSGAPPPLPSLLMSATNRIQSWIIDREGGLVHVLDYVQLGNMNAAMNINETIADNSINVADTQGLWSTNGYQGGTMPYGVFEQFEVSSLGGVVPTEDQDGGGAGGLWTTTPVSGIPNSASSVSSQAQQAFFSAFFSAQNRAPYAGATGGYVSNIDLSIQAPFTPIRVAVQRFVYQANDPLVHYLSSDLYDFADNSNTLASVSAPPPPLVPALGIQSDRYAPWGTPGNMSSFDGFSSDHNAFNLSYKDPLVLMSDNWDFPTNKYPTVGWLGRVHRGTPWQTVYLKSTNVLNLQIVSGGGAGARVTANGLATWMPWSGNVFNSYDAQNAAPIEDRLLFDVFTATPSDEATRGRLSVNVGANDVDNPMTGLAAWSALLSASLAFSNNLADVQLNFGTHAQSPVTYAPWRQTAPSYSTFTVQPLGAPPYPGANRDITNSPMWQIVRGINNARTNYIGPDGLQGTFEHVGDVLSAPQLSEQSPYLHWRNNGATDAAQQEKGISDEMYEWLPQQTLGLMTVSGTPQSPPRYVIYCYGQTLKPAPNGLVTSGTYFGLVTNYQVTAESASRAVIRIENAPTPANPNATPHVIVEQYNPLPPD